MKKLGKRLLYIGSGLTIGLIILLFASVTTVDRTPYKETDYYARMSARLDSLKLNKDSISDTFLVGWAKVNISPSAKMDLAGYGVRGQYDTLVDSIYVRSFVLQLQQKKVVLLTADLLIMPPIVVEEVYSKLASIGFRKEQIYLSATHTHNAPGGWAGGLAGSYVAGKYNPEYIRFLSDKFLQCIQLADQNKEAGEMGYGQWAADKFVRNRLNYEDSKIDGWIRGLKFRKKSGKEALLITYSAHANCLYISNHSLSCDYPGILIKALENEPNIEFASFMAGMVGSHSPALEGELRDVEQTRFVGNGLASVIHEHHMEVKFSPVTRLENTLLPLELRDPHLKIEKDYRIRPWLFKTMLGDWSCNIKILQIGNVLMLGMPCDFSGELMSDIEPVAKSHNLNLIITSFNGGYIGYINVDKYYDYDRMETRAMNWFGPYNQAYFTEISQRIVEKAAR